MASAVARLERACVQGFKKTPPLPHTVFIWFPLTKIATGNDGPESHTNHPGTAHFMYGTDNYKALVPSLWLRLRNDLYCVEWGVKLYSLTHPSLWVQYPS